VKIYTRKGDAGETSLFGGRRVPKDETRVEAFGSVDELSSALGVALARWPAQLAEWREPLRAIQSDLFTLGAMLATPEPAAARPAHIPALAETRVTQLEAWIDRLDEELPDLRAFVLPGGSEPAAALHLARSVCRRAERRAVTLSRAAEVDPVAIRYLNRLSDFLFTLARAANLRLGVAEVEWHPPEPA
jgi:cob(I)alamin adenosyltransferase